MYKQMVKMKMVEGAIPPSMVREMDKLKRDMKRRRDADKKERR